ncbi:hypothetical protein BCR35DRAFT_301332 [Leucosporidium creatinivorum]|uniref:Uncharacterized protein n=1 Tax=Leucosporidium creatinivorum TaxID=106004 RepID=A0A1Y2FZ00_9BASI|nr:hypothetical protein BCR35DRAFT_301332 [Leucosporidium creatinivorum]
MSCSGSYAYGYGGTQATGTNAYTARARREAEWQQHLDETVCKTPGMKEYGLTAKEIEKIPYTKARNNYHPSAAPYKIFQREDLRVASEKKWGGVYDPETKTVRELVEKKKQQQRQHQPEHEQQPAAGPSHSTPRNPLELPSIGADLEFDLFYSDVSSDHTRAVAFRTFVDSHRDATTAYAALEEKKKNKKPRVAVQTPGKKRPAPAAPQSSPLKKKAKRGGKGKGKGKKSIYVDATDSEDEGDEAFVLHDDDDEEEEDQRVEEKQQEEGDEEVRKPETKIISWTQAKNDFKVTDAELKTIAHTEETTSSGKRTLRFVNTDHVWDLALESHGGLAGHKAHLAKCQARSEKTKATKLANRVKAAAGEA